MLASGLPKDISDDEHLTRFLTSSSQFNSQGVKPSAFLPSPNDRETSVFRHSGEPKEELWRIGADHVANGRTIYGAGIVQTVNVRATQLDVSASEPPPRHAAIRGWPYLDDPELQKAQQKEKAMLIASKAILLRP